MLANTSKELLPDNLYYLKLYAPDNVEISTVEASSLPDNWKTYPAPYKLADMASNRFNKKQTPALKVPSVIVPFEFNILLDPLHPLFKKVNIVEAAAFTVDFRLEE